jgi:putative membrane protein
MQQDNTNVGKGACIFIGIQLIVTVLAMLFHPLVDLDATYVLDGQRWFFEHIWDIAIFFQLVFVLWHSILLKGAPRAIAAAGITIFIAWYAEWLGVNYGGVFGWYNYSHQLEPQLWGVPLIICMAWEPILYSSYLVVDWLLPSDLSRMKGLSKKIIPILFMAVCGTVVCTVWDLMADPVSVTRGWWNWHDGGPYMSDIQGGVPISNYLGWMKVAFVCHIIYRLILETSPITRRSIYLNVYGPVLQYINLYFIFAFAALVMLKRLDVLLIGGLAMGGLILLAVSKLYLARFSAAKESWERTEAVEVSVAAQMEEKKN